MVIAALALGLGLGLGLSNGSGAAAAAAGCYSALQSNISKTKADWKPKLPTECPGQLTCPPGYFNNKL